MFNIYKKVERFVFKPVLCAGLFTVVTLADYNGHGETKAPKTYFDNWGYVDHVWGGLSPQVALELGDLDSDGDLDMIVATSGGGIRIYENRIPQKR